jgi:hypothetical protein
VGRSQTIEGQGGLSRLANPKNDAVRMAALRCLSFEVTNMQHEEAGMATWISRARFGVAVLAATLALSAPDARAQGDDPLIAEVMRKGAAGENENGFCRRAPWPVETSTTDTGAFYQNAVPGTAKTFKDNYSGPIPYCAYILVENVTNEGDRRCIYTQMWWCHFGRQCHHRSYRGCRGATGPYVWDE